VSASQTAHSARLIQTQMTRKARRPQGNYTHDTFQWGLVNAINAGPPATVDLYLNGTHQTANPDLITPSVPYLASYVPTLGDVVLVQRGLFRNRTSRVIVGKLYGSPSPYPLPLGNIDPGSGRFISGPNAIWGGFGAPNPNLGQLGDVYFRTDAVGLEAIYQFVANGWVSFQNQAAVTTNSQTYSVSGTLQVASGATGYLPPFYVPVTGTTTLDSVFCSVRSGSATVTITQNGTNISSGITVTSTPSPTSIGLPVQNNDAFAPVITAVSEADGLSISFYFTISS